MIQYIFVCVAYIQQNDFTSSQYYLNVYLPALVKSFTTISVFNILLSLLGFVLQTHMKFIVSVHSVNWWWLLTLNSSTSKSDNHLSQKILLTSTLIRNQVKILQTLMSIIECTSTITWLCDDQQYYGVTNHLLQKKHYTIIDAYPLVH